MVFSEGVERVVVALPDVGVLVREVLGRASPALAEKIPPTVTQSLALVMLGLGIAVVLNPAVVAAGIAALGGLMLAYGGIRELFTLLEQWVASVPALETVARRRGWSAPALASLLLVAAAGPVWVLLRNPTTEVVAPTVVTTCNGSPMLCDRRVDQVTFPAAHNAQSNVDSPDWMFPHHQAGIQTMLRDGIRAFAIDIHHGFSGGARIKTDLAGLSAAKLTEAVGEEAAQIAERIRNTLVGADEGKRDLYFCHGFCELGAYDPRPSLRAMREFMIANPDEVVILIIEDYVTAEDLGRLFEEAGLTDLVFRGPVPAQWPTLRELITSNQRLIVFTERGTPGVPWPLPTLGQIQETPYTFKTPADFSCRPNRGGTTGALFLINHWLETTPSPKPSNAAIANAHDVLLGRARECLRERQKLPNILMVDFYRTGHLVAVVAELNGAAADTTRQMKLGR